jgi:YidC/Oxa1 family membrane protein insertase
METSGLSQLGEHRPNWRGYLIFVILTFVFFGWQLCREKHISFSLSDVLFYILNWDYIHITHNWGWAIVLLTIVFNLALLPLRIRTVKSTAKLQRLQPQINAIKKKSQGFKLNDPRRGDMQRELIELQKKEDVDIFGGCLPMLIQWPMLIAFYRMLSHATVLRRAHWLWLPDLSSPDPYHILPAVFILSMFLTQILNSPPGMDRNQQRVVALLTPLIFGFTAWKYGSGLALYWTCSNIVGVLLQLVINQFGLQQTEHDRVQPERI